MNKKGFTLVEVIVVIAIFAILGVILVPNIFVLINKNNEKACNSLINNIKSATMIYVNNNKYDLGFGCNEEENTKYITLQELIDTGDLKTDDTGKIINPVYDTEIKLDSVVKVQYNCNTKIFTYDVQGINCYKNNNDDNLTEEQENTEKISQAIYSETDNSLTFVNTNKLTKGEDYNGKTVTEVYINFEIEAENATQIPWSAYREKIKTVIVEDLISPPSTAYWFYFFVNCTQFDLQNLDTSNVTDMQNMFYNCRNLSQLNINSWDTSNVTNMISMFYGCKNLTILNLNDWDTSNVQYMNSMFSSCNLLKNLEISDWDTSNVRSMAQMFNGCRFTTLDINNWNTSKVTNMNSMFYGCKNLIILNLNDWDTSNVTNMSEMFEHCQVLEKLNIDSWNTSNVTDMQNMFDSCFALKELVLNWDTSKVTNMRYMFSNCNNLYKLNIDSWNTSNVKDMYCMFYGCDALTELNISEWDTSNVVDMGHMFYWCQNLELDLSKWNVKKVTLHFNFSTNSNITEPKWSY